MHHPTLLIGNQSNGVTLVTWRRTHAGTSDYWDGNWVSTRIEILAGGFRGKIEADLRSEEFDAFRKGVQQLYATLNGRAELSTLEGWITLTLEGDGRGHVKVTGAVLDQPGIGNRLIFNFDLDQTYLPEVIEQLNLILETYPVVGTA